MGYRANVVTRYEVEYGDQLGFNYDFEGFCNFLRELNIEYSADENSVWVEIDVHSLLGINSEKILPCIKNEEQRLALNSMINTAKTAKYAQECGFLRIEFF